MRQVKLLKVSFPILTLLVMVLAIAGQQQLIARADTCSASICQLRAGYVAHGGSGTYKYVETTFTVPGNLRSPNGNTSVNNKFSMGVSLGGDNQFGEANWLSAGVDFQVTNGQIASKTSFWSLPSGATNDSRASSGYARTNVRDIEAGDTIFVSIALNSSSRVTFSMRDNRSGQSDTFPLTISDSSKLPQGQTAGCVLFFNVWDKIANPFPLAHPTQASFSGCKVGADPNSGGAQTIDQTNPFPYTANGLSDTATLDPSDGGNFNVVWNGSGTHSGDIGNGACSNGKCQRAGYVAQGGSGTYKYVESTFTLPRNQDIITGRDGKFSIGVSLDSGSGSPRWAAAGVDNQVINGQLASQTAFWSVTDGANIHDTRGEGSGHGFFPSTVRVQPGDEIFASVQLQSQGQIIFTMDDRTNGGHDQFTLNLDDSSKQPDGSMAGCALFFSPVSGARSINDLAHPRQTKFSGCKVGADQGSAQTIDQANPSQYTASGLSSALTLTSPPNFTVNWEGPGASRVQVNVQSRKKVR
jgi:hypothetical protein